MSISFSSSEIEKRRKGSILTGECKLTHNIRKLDRSISIQISIPQKFPILHEFYRGMELHPTIFGVQVKQLVNCRIGMMLWQLLVLIFFSAAYQMRGFDSGHLVNVLLQTIYLYKFMRWETG